MVDCYYLTHVILPRLSREDCSLVRTWSSNDVIVMLNDVILQCRISSFSGNSGYSVNSEQEKEFIICVRVG